MKQIYTINELQDSLTIEKRNSRSIGFVPTMGALHPGHIELVKQCVAENDICVVSIFVNPTQFNDKSDLEKYPRTLEADCKLLEEAGCSYVFIPGENEIYPEPDSRLFDFGSLGSVMEGKFRPGHFNGVAQVVSRLFDIVKPDRAYFGEKDFQQLAIIKQMVKQEGYPVEIIPVPIVRETSGLAMSSRNARLSEVQLKEAVNISKVLLESVDKQQSMNVQKVSDWVINSVNQSPELQTEYFEIVDADTLQAIQNWNDSDSIVGCIAVFDGEVRLIDNIRYK